MYLEFKKSIRPVRNFLIREEVLNKISIPEQANSITPYESVRAEAYKEIKKLHKKPEEFRNQK